jgi:hypothetical protein
MLPTLERALTPYDEEHAITNMRMLEKAQALPDFPAGIDPSQR